MISVRRIERKRKFALRVFNIIEESSIKQINCTIYMMKQITSTKENQDKNKICTKGNSFCPEMFH